jgi:hypothetical protein
LCQIYANIIRPLDFKGNIQAVFHALFTLPAFTVQTMRNPQLGVSQNREIKEGKVMNIIIWPSVIMSDAHFKTKTIFGSLILLI